MRRHGEQLWNIEYYPVIPWLDRQDDNTVACVFAALELLQQKGPALGRPLVDTVKGSKVKNMKELRPASPGDSEIRILFAFDPERSAVLLLAGDKSKGKNNEAKWSGWYKRAIPQAERVYRAHVERLEQRNGRA